MIVVAAVWIGVLLLIGGFALDRVLARGIVQNFDQQLEYVLNAMIAASEIGPDGEVRFTRPPADQRFLEPYSGAYFQISGQGPGNLPVPLAVGPAAAADASHNDVELHKRDSFEFAGEPLRILERDVMLPGIGRPLALPGRPVARGDRRADPRASRRRWSAASPRSALGLLVLAALQAILRPVAAAPGAARSGGDPRRHPDPRSPRISRARSSRWSMRSTSCWPIARRRPRKRGAMPATSPMR